MPTTEVAVVEPEFSDVERYALAAFLAGYRGLTRDAYALDLRQFIAWCDEHHVRLFTARRADIECFARELEARGRARATGARRLCTVAGFYRYAEQEGLLERRRRPTCAGLAWTTSPTPPAWTATRSERCSSAPDWPRPREHALVSLLAINGRACRRLSALTSRRSASNGATARSRCCETAARWSPSARPAHGPSDPPGHRRTGRGADLPRSEPRAARPARRLAHRTAVGAQGRDQQAGRAAHSPPCVHHRRPRRGRPTPGRAGDGQPRGSAHDDALRQDAGVPRPARHLCRGRVPRRRRPVARSRPATNNLLRRRH